MNITFVSDAIYPYNKGGKEKRLYELSTRLAAMGHDVHIYTMHWWESPEKSRIEHGVHLHAISRFYPMYKGDVRSIKQGVLFGLACFRLFRIKFEILDVDHMPFFPIYSAWLVCLFRGKRFHGTWHEALSRKDWVNYMGAAGNIAALVERISVQLPHAVTAASDHTHRLIKTELKRRRNISVVSSGIDVGLINAVKPARRRIDVLYAGRLVKDKNIDKLVDAIGLAAKTMPSLRCTIVGHGAEKQRIMRQIKKLKLQSHINLVEPLTNASDIYAYMKISRVFCLPSVREGFGIVALESLACNTPVITTSAPANAAKDLINGKNGSVVSLTVESLAQAITRWVSNARPRALAKTVADYGWDSLAEKQLGVYIS
ncbi:MAG: hypothetical protein JWN38_43 [Candidatus Saccharibacteria bacterium]|nr:hypothetical protein [Candidatus Saccharibacteria bacterium]